jgi:hypothetical protein
MQDSRRDTRTPSPILTPGNYTITQGVESGWTLEAVNIVDPSANSSYNLATGVSTIRVGPGETVLVTYVNVGS